MNKFYGKVAMSDCNGYDFYSCTWAVYDHKMSADTFRSSRIKNKSVFTSEYFKLILDGLEAKCANITPPKGSKLFIASRNYISLQEIKNNYNIAKYPDSGDYNVIEKYSSDYPATAGLGSYTMIIDDTQKNVIGVHNYHRIEDKCKTKTVADFFGIKISDNAYTADNISLCASNSIPDFAIQFFINGAKKPTVSYKNLLNIDNDITLDTLKILELAASQPFCGDPLKMEIITVLKSLTQYNWRKYKGTLRNLFTIMNTKTYSVFHYLFGHQSQLPTTIKPIFNEFTKSICYSNSVSKNDFVCEDDFYLFQEWIKDKTNIKGQIYVNRMMLNKQLQKCDLSKSVFYSVFDDIIKLTPKQYKDKDKDKDKNGEDSIGNTAE